jgi:hypothetical protein
LISLLVAIRNFPSRRPAPAQPGEVHAFTQEIASVARKHLHRTSAINYFNDGVRAAEGLKGVARKRIIIVALVNW